MWIEVIVFAVIAYALVAGILMIAKPRKAVSILLGRDSKNSKRMTALLDTPSGLRNYRIIGAFLSSASFYFIFKVLESYLGDSK